MSDTQKNRIAVQEALIMFAEELSRGYEDYNSILRRKSDSGPAAVQAVNHAESPSSFVLQREKDAGRVAYGKEDLQQFVNGFDSMSISLLQPYVRFEKFNKKRGETFVLDMNNSNVSSFRSFINGAKTGKGTIGFGPRQNPGGFGIKNLELEYMANEKSGYCFNQYKLEVEVFCASIEDIVADLGGGKSGHTLLDVLIAFPEDIKKLQEGLRRGEDTGEFATAFQTIVEFGYNIHEHEKEIAQRQADVRALINKTIRGDKNPVSFTRGYSAFAPLEKRGYSEQTKMLIKQSGSRGPSLRKFTKMLQQLRFRVYLTPYKWIFDFEQKGNLTLKISYIGYDNLISAKNAANVMASFGEVEDYQKNFVSKLKKKPVSTATTRDEMEKEKKEAEKEKKRIDEERSVFLKGIRKNLIQRPYSRLGLLGASYDMLVDYSIFDESEEARKKKEGKEESFADRLTRISDEIKESFGAEKKGKNFKDLYKGYGVTFKGNWNRDYNFDKILDNSSRSSHLVDTNRRQIYETTAQTEADVRASEATTWSLGSTPTQDNVELGKSRVFITVSRVPYFYLGDLLGIMALTVEDNLKKSGEYGPATRVEFLTDQIKIPAPWSDKLFININIAAIPISWSFFLNWWADKIMLKKNLVYKLEEFLQEFLGHFVQQLFKQSEVVDSVPLNFGSHVIEKKLDPIGSSKVISFYLYQRSTEKDPAVRFYLGNARGLVKDVQFEVVDDQYLSSASMQMAVENQQPDNNLQFQRAIYNASITLFGNIVFQPGMTIEVVPSLVGAPFSDSSRIRNIYDLGIGGMYGITSTKISIRQGNFETKLTTRWWSKPQQKMIDLSSM